MVCYFHLLKNIPQFAVIHTSKTLVKSVKQKYMLSLEFTRFFYEPTDVGNMISGSSAFSKSGLYIWKFSVRVLMKPSLENFEHYLVACEMSAIAQ